ncbi:hypothetical protein CLV83_1448 [Marinobacterium mangrovicola]|uniref:AprE-like long alpha-helical hairpin domain-containing protein n=1 Tax=Marinobacterium mangrovicola TaxID=1476959 RepID=A0A4R1GY02_9GAMM|nr:hypothetical protein CLV83_1448 [Marinobacterium mangrovicola]
MKDSRLTGHTLVNKFLGFSTAALFCLATSIEVSAAGESASKTPRLTSEQFKIQARMAQLHAEADGQPSISFSPELMAAAAADPSLASVLDDAQERFKLIKAERGEKQAELRRRIESAKNSIDVQQQELTDNRNRLAMVSRKLESLEPAVEKGLIGENYLSALNSEVEQLTAQCDGLEDNIAQIKWNVAEYSLQLSEQDADRRRVVQAQLEALESRKRQAERFEEELVASETSIQRQAYPAPESQSYPHSSME